MSEQRHLSLPWRYRKGVIEQDASLVPVARMYRTYESNYPANAEFICRACNSHYDLLEALKNAATSLNTISTLAGRDEYLSEIMQIRQYANSREQVARAAIAKAEGK